MPTLRTSQRPAVPELRTGQVLVVAAVGPVITGYVMIAAVLALVAAAAPNATVTAVGVLRAAGPAWLAAYHVPVDVAGHELGVLPLLPTILLLALVARSAGNAARRLDWTTPRSAAIVIGTVGGTHAVIGTGIAVLCLGGTVAASPVIAFCCAGALSAVAATVGTARQCGLVAACLARADDATGTGLRAGGLAVLGVAAAGAVVYAVGLLASWPTAAALFPRGGGLGMFLLCLAYLPNALVGTVSLVAGPGFTLGRVTVAPWHFHGGAVPAVPVLAPLPATAAPWWPALVLLPVGVGVLVGRVSAAVPGPDRLRAVGIAALVTAVAWLVLAALAGGALAGGPFDPVTVPAGALAAAVCLAVAVPGAVTVWLIGHSAPVPDLADAELVAADDSAVVEEPAEEA